MGAGATLLGVLVALGCGNASLFLCDESGDCMEGDIAGTCQPGGLCSFPDDECAAGQRYGDHAGNVSGECVPDVDPTSGSTSGATSVGSATSTTGTVPATTTPVGEDSTSTSGPIATSTGPGPSTTSTSSEESTGGDISTSGTSAGMESSGGMMNGQPYGLCEGVDDCAEDWDCVDFSGEGDTACVYQCSAMDPCPAHPDGLPVFCYEEMGIAVCLISCDPSQMQACPPGYGCYEDPTMMFSACIPS